MNVFKNASNTVIVVCLTVLAIMVLASVTLLSAINKDPKEIMSLIQLILGGGATLMGAGTWVYASAAANKADTAATTMTNGTLEGKIAAAVKTGLTLHVAELHDGKANQSN